MSDAVLITGAFGLVGTATVKHLSRLGRHVIVTDLDTPANRKAAAALPAGVTLRWADLTDARQVSELVTTAAPAAVIHLAAIIPPLCYANPALARRVNVDATANLVKVAAAQPVPPRFVQASSIAVYGPRNPYRFSDVLTAETMRTDLLDLWSEGQLPIRGVIMVTHNIEEAVLMCDRILVFSTNPGRIVTEIPVTLPQPRDRLDPTFRALVERIYVEMTDGHGASRPAPRAELLPGTGIGTILPQVSSNLLSGLIEAVAGAPYLGHADLPAIASALHMEIDDLFPVAESLQMLRFVELDGGDIRLTDAGRAFAESAVDDRKRAFARHLLAYVPLATHIRRVLDERASHRAPKSRFQDELEDHMTTGAAEQTLRAVTSWGRYGETFAYDDIHGAFTLENPS